MKKINVAIILGILIVLFSWGAVEVYKEKRARDEIDKLVKELNLEGKFYYDDVDYSILSGKLELTGVRWTVGGETVIERITVYRYTPSDLVVSVEGIRGEDDDFGRDMKELGIENPVLNFYIDASVYDDERELVVRRFAINMPQAFEVSVNFELSNVTSSLLRDIANFSENDREALNNISARVAKVKVKNFSLVFEDLGLRERILEEEAKRKKKSKEELVKDLVADMEKSLKKAKTDIEKDFIKSIISFVKEGGKVTFSLNPDRPLELQEVIFAFAISAQTKDVTPLVRDLRLSVRHTK